MRPFHRLQSFAAALSAGISALPATAQAQIGEQDSGALARLQRVARQDSGLYDYTFTLELDNHTGSWSSLTHQGYGGLVFGDVPNANSPLADFTLAPGTPSIGVWSGAHTDRRRRSGRQLSQRADARAGFRRRIESHHLVSHRHRGFAELVGDQHE